MVDKLGEEIKKGLAQIESLGKGLTHKPAQVEKIPTGVASFDYMLDGGWAKGRIHEIYGGESSGKSTLCLLTIAETQRAIKRSKKSMVCAYVDAEHSFDPVYAEFLGVDVDALQLIYPNWGEQAFEATRILSMTKHVALVVVDSVAALCPQSEYEGNINEGQMGAHPALMSKGLRQINADLHNTGTTVLFINQLREKLGGYGNPETTPGGRALKFYSTQRVAVRGSERLKDGKENEIGFIAKIKCTKNKSGVAQRTCELAYFHGKGFSKGYDLFNAGLSSGSIVQGGSFYTLSDGRRIQGKQAVIDLLDAEAKAQVV